MKIITVVGTSLIANWGRDSTKDLEHEQYAEQLFDGNKDSGVKRRIAGIETSLSQYIKESGNNASAELASLAKIDPKAEMKIYLLCTDTALSFLCGRVLAKHLGERVKKIQAIKSLQVKDVTKFKQEGVPNLLVAIENIAQNGHYWDDLVLNITGGYKAIVPILTIIGQVKRLPTYYIFEETEQAEYALIEIPRMPVGYQTEVFENHWSTFVRFGERGDEMLEATTLERDFLEECGGCLEIAGNLVALNPVGKILWWNYRQHFFLFNTSDEIWQIIQRQQEIKRILETKFYDQQAREAKTERKQDHYVFDDGDNNNRIYYFTQGEQMFIYRTFQSEEDARSYISTPFSENSRNEFAQKSQPFRIKIQR